MTHSTVLSVSLDPFEVRSRLPFDSSVFTHTGLLEGQVRRVWRARGVLACGAPVEVVRTVRWRQ
jgi:hypothetical protein